MLRHCSTLSFLILIHGLAPTSSGFQSGEAKVYSSSSRAAYTAEFRTTLEQRLPDGTSAKTESKEVDIVDSQVRHLVAVTESALAGQQPNTHVQVSDPVTDTLKYWSVPGTTAQLVNAPDVGEDTDCARKMKAITPLHPAKLQTICQSRIWYEHHSRCSREGRTRYFQSIDDACRKHAFGAKDQ